MRELTLSCERAGACVGACATSHRPPCYFLLCLGGHPAQPAGRPHARRRPVSREPSRAAVLQGLPPLRLAHFLPRPRAALPESGRNHQRHVLCSREGTDCWLGSVSSSSISCILYLPGELPLHSRELECLSSRKFLFLGIDLEAEFLELAPDAGLCNKPEPAAPAPVTVQPQVFVLLIEFQCISPSNLSISTLNCQL